MVRFFPKNGPAPLRVRITKILDMAAGYAKLGDGTVDARITSQREAAKGETVLSAAIPAVQASIRALQACFSLRPPMASYCCAIMPWGVGFVGSWKMVSLLV